MTRCSLTLTILLGAVSFHAASGNECECLNWKESMRINGNGRAKIRCGMGPTWDNIEKCGEFYMRFDGNQCVNLKPGQEGADQWCFVSNECQELNGGNKKVEVQDKHNTTRSWKMCTKEDPRLRDMEPTALVKLAEKIGWDGFIMKLVEFAYPRSKSLPLWPSVQPVFGVGADGLKTLPYGLKNIAHADVALPAVQGKLAERWGGVQPPKKGGTFMEKLRAKTKRVSAPKVNENTKALMKKIVDSGEPVMLDTAFSHDEPYALLWGKKVYAVWMKDIVPMGPAVVQ